MGNVRLILAKERYADLGPTQSKAIQVSFRSCCSSPRRDQSHTPVGKIACNRAHCCGVNDTL